jgi:hypothetical protein
MQEEFKKIQHYQLYSVSNLGNVRNDKTGKMLKQGLSPDDYKTVRLRGEDEKYVTKYVHRLVAIAFIPNVLNKSEVDHINNDGKDNRVQNLRWASHQENCFNTSMNISNTSGAKGVSYHKKSNKWQANICINGKQKYLGTFTDKEEAIKARFDYASKVMGEFINQCEVIKQKRVELDEELEQLEREFEALVNGVMN